MKKDVKIAAMFLGFLALEIFLYFYVDRPIALFMRDQDFANPDVVNFFRRVTDVGKAVWYLPPCGLAALVCAFLARGKDVPAVYRRLCGYIGTRALFVFLSIGVSGVIVSALKPLIGRARPAMFLREAIFGFSPLTTQGFLWNGMPSGHSTTVFALACSLAILYPRGRVVWFTYAVLLAASRVIVDAHYVSDVAAGAMLGWLTTRLFYQYGISRITKVIFPIDNLPVTE